MIDLKHLLFTMAIFASSCAFAQNTVKIVDLPPTYNQQFDFKGKWMINSDDMNNSYLISGTQIVNTSSSRTNDLSIDLYFVPTQSEYSIKNLPNKLSKETILGQIDGNKSSFNNVKIIFNENEISHLKAGVYNVVLVLKDKKSGDIKNYKILDNTLRYIDGQFRLVDESAPSTKLADKTYAINGEKIDHTLSNVYTTVKSSLSLAYTPNQVVLAGDWKLDVDFSTLMVNISGVNNSIQNRTHEKTNNLKLLVYFAEQEPKDFSNIEGYELLNVDIKPIEKSSEIKNTRIKTNITKTLPSGVYFPILVLTEADENGNYNVKSTIRFKNQYTF